jgi:ribose 5-phosphate isomerase B
MNSTRKAKKISPSAQFSQTKKEKTMKIVIGADEKLSVVNAAIAYLEKNNHPYAWYGPDEGVTTPWPLVARQVAEDVVSGKAEQGILFCWTGTGVSIAANKIPGIRAALCFDAETARGARLWNKANVLCLSMRLTTEIVVVEILDAWFNTEYTPNPIDDACLATLAAIEEDYR